MRAYFLHWDEELINDRVAWLRPKLEYSAEHIAFLLQFYSLFFDEVLTPANFLTDSFRTPFILDSLNFADKDSAIRSEKHPLRVFWDKKYHGSEINFEKLLARLHGAKDEDKDVSFRDFTDMELLLKSMRECDTLLQDKIVAGETNIQIQNRESLEQLESDVFNVSRNASPLISRDVDILLECLAATKEFEKHQAPPDPYRYGRNLIYQLFGLSRPRPVKSHLDMSNEFAKYIPSGMNDYTKRLFIRSMDYVSNRLKVVHARRAMGLHEHEHIGILMPSEFLDVMISPTQAKLLGMAELDNKTIDMRIWPVVSQAIHPHSIRMMTGQQFNSLSGGAQDEARNSLLAIISKDPVYVSDADIVKCQLAFDGYFKKIGKVLNRTGYYRENLVTLCLQIARDRHTILATVSLVAGASATISGFQNLTQSAMLGLLAFPVSLSAQIGMKTVIDNFELKRDLARPLGGHTIESTSGVRIYLS